MWRALFFATGIYLTTCGLSLLAVDKVHLQWRADCSPTPAGTSTGSAFRVLTVDETQQYVFQPPGWIPFTLLTLGGVTALYALGLPKRPMYREQ